MYNIAHLSDLHLGYTSGRKRTEDGNLNLRENDGYIAFENIINQILNEKIDCVVITGDVFHSPTPKVHTILKARSELRKLANAGIKVYILAGNHDSTDVRSAPASSVLLDEPHYGIYSYDIPYIKKEIHDGIWMHFVSHHMFTDHEDIMNEIKLVDNAINILATHGSCYDTTINALLHTEQSPREVVISQKVMEKDWDYTFLGHIHERGWVGSKNGTTDTAKRKQFYNGSILRRGFSDKESKLGRGWTKWNIDSKGKFKPTFFNIKERPQYDLPTINAKDKTVIQIEEEIEKQLQSVIDELKDENNNIPIENAPIVRQSVSNLNTMVNLSIHWQSFANYTKDFLSHSFRRITITNTNETKDNNNVDIKSIRGNDIVKTFISWTKEEGQAIINDIEKTVQDEVIAKSKELLSEARDTVLSENDE